MRPIRLALTIVGSRQELTHADFRQRLLVGTRVFTFFHSQLPRTRAARLPESISRTHLFQTPTIATSPASHKPLLAKPRTAFPLWILYLHPTSLRGHRRKYNINVGCRQVEREVPKYSRHSIRSLRSLCGWTATVRGDESALRRPSRSRRIARSTVSAADLRIVRGYGRLGTVAA